MLAPMITNALTIDVEDYFQVSAFAPYIRRDEWDLRECRVERNVDRILAMLDDHDTKATFFTLGWIAERYPQLVRRIVDGGHELASHGYGHQRASDLNAAELLRRTSTRAKQLLEDLCGTRGQRLPGAELLDRRAQPVGLRMPRPCRLPLQLAASTRSSTTTTACPTRRASPTG